jgi:hypothetical protein
VLSPTTITWSHHTQNLHTDPTHPKPTHGPTTPKTYTRTQHTQNLHTDPTHAKSCVVESWAYVAPFIVPGECVALRVNYFEATMMLPYSRGSFTARQQAEEEGEEEEQRRALRPGLPKASG